MNKQAYITGRRSTCVVYRLALGAILIVVTSAALLASSANASAAGLEIKPAQATATPGQNSKAPAPASTSNVPGAVATSVNGGVAAPGGVKTPAGGGTGPAAANNSGNFPWLFLLVLLPLAIAGIAYAASRRRETTVVREVTESAASVGTGRAATGMRKVQAYRGPATDGGLETGSAPPEVVASTVSTVTTVVPVGAAKQPASVQCPNCDTTNSPGERFCRECGQDLRPRRTQPAAPPRAQQPPKQAPPAAPPVDIVGEDTPYLETLSRVDEQLEFVLSRSRVRIGSAPGNDIVIDPEYTGWESVSPHHAELRQEQGSFRVIDQNSESGTFVNETRTDDQVLSDGDTLRLGDVRFIFRVPSVE